MASRSRPQRALKEENDVTMYVLIATQGQKDGIKNSFKQPFP